MRALDDTSAERQHTGDAYARAISRRGSDRAARAAFHDRVALLAGSGATILDFGAGTGIDAKHYAQRGHRVIAYDSDPAMSAAFSIHCREEIAAGKIRLIESDYQSFLAGDIPPHGNRVELVTANFAPLNLIDDIAPLFEKLHAVTSSRGRILASVLNPSFIGDLIYRWWWMSRADYRRRGRYSVEGARWNITRRSVDNFRDTAAPYFELQSVHRPLHRYLFLLFEKP